MRFNRQELISLASQPSTKFDKEGVLYLRERQDGFFRRSELNLERWCRLRGNMLFYFKSRDQWSEPLGVIVLEQCTVTADPAPPSVTNEPHFGFYLVFDGGVTQYLAAPTEQERSSWLQALHHAGYDCLRLRLQMLQEQLEMRRGQDPNLDVEMWRLQRSHQLDPNEVPICEVSIFCDNLLCDGNGRPPNPMVVVHVFLPLESVCIKYAETEVIQRSSNPSFLNTICFRSSDGLTKDARIKLSAVDVRERISMTAAPLGQAVITLASIQESQRLRIPLRCSNRTTVGFLSMVVWTVEREEVTSADSTPRRTVPSSSSQMVIGHRRCHSLPPRLSAKLLLPHQGALTQLFANPIVHTYRFHSGLGGDICVQETLAESRISLTFPQQMLGVWIQEEKELLQEVAGMGELGGPWHERQIELLERHLSCLKAYSQAKEYLHTLSNRHFKQSARKKDTLLEFAPTNLHLQRMWVQNDSLKKSGFYDIVSVGAFTAHSPMHNIKTGGLIKLVQSLSEITEGGQSQISTKTRMACEAVAAIKQLRREVVDGMRTLMRLAKEKRTQGMLPICEEMVKKTRTLLSVWDAGLVEEALAFVEENKLVQIFDDGVTLSDDTSLTFSLSPYRLITQKLNLELKSPDLDDLATPDSPNSARRLWERSDHQNYLHGHSNGANLTSQDYQHHCEQLSVLSLPVDEHGKEATEEVTNLREFDANRNGAIKSEKDDVRWMRRGHSEDNGDVGRRRRRQHGSDDNDNVELDSRMFLDTQAMCDSPSANYYKPTDEPEPWDLTQLNIEASVMCLVSKVKFLCGRCGSPAVRLRQRSAPVVRSRGFLCNGSGSPVVTSQPAGRISSDVIQAVDSVSRVVNGAVNGPARNKFTDGLDFDSITDWTCELRPSMRKLRQAMDGLLKTARLTHSAFRVQEDRRVALKVSKVRYRRDVCFSQALTALVTSLMAKLWCQKPDPVFLLALTSLGPLAVFECLLSHHGDEIDMWGDMSVAVEDLATVNFTLARHKTPSEMPEPIVSGTRSSLTVRLPVPDAVHSMLPLQHSSQSVCFHVTPVFFNVGINEMASMAEAMGTTKPQDKSNIDNFERLNLYFHQYRKICPVTDVRAMEGFGVADLVDKLRITVSLKQPKNVQILHLAARICRKLKGLRFTSCKSAKDRTGMSVTLEQANVLVAEYDLAEHEFQGALDCMRSQGCRLDNTTKNTGVKKYAINNLQILALPPLYRPPPGTYGSNVT